MSESPPKAWVVYVDGLNFHVSVKGRPEAKWVDLRQVATRLIPAGNKLDGVKYFTSQISAKAAEDPGSPNRQRLLIRAAQATPGVEVFEGKFQVPEVWRSVSSKGTCSDRLRPPLPDGVISTDAAHFASHDPVTLEDHRGQPTQGPNRQYFQHSYAQFKSRTEVEIQPLPMPSITTKITKLRQVRHRGAVRPLTPPCIGFDRA